MKSELEFPDLQELRSNPTSRRTFLKAMGAAGLGMAAVSLLDGCGGGSSNNGGSGGSFPLTSLPGNNDQKILNYALTLEFLEADLYRQALNFVSGVNNPTTTPLVANPASYSLAVSAGNLSSGAADAGFRYIRAFAFVEKAHAQFLKTALGSTAVTPKTYSFGSLAPTTINVQTVLSALLPLEETGVRAYLGAGKYFNSLSLLQTAVTIYSTEARHSSAINYILGKDPGPYTLAGDQFLYPIGSGVSDNTFEHYLEPQAVLNTISSLGLITSA